MVDSGDDILGTVWVRWTRKRISFSVDVLVFDSVIRFGEDLKFYGRFQSRGGSLQPPNLYNIQF